MILNPRMILSRRILTSLELPFDKEDQIQPNGIDVRVKNIRQIQCDMHKPFKMWADGRKEVPNSYICEGTLLDDNPAFVLHRGYAYDAEMYEHVKIPEGIVGFIYGRSSLHRNGVFCRASVYDSGFDNRIGLMMFPFQDFWVEQGTRIAQIVFMEAKSSHQYHGQYNRKDK